MWRELMRRLFQQSAAPPPPVDESERLRDEWEREQVRQRIELLEREAALAQRRQYRGGDG